MVLKMKRAPRLTFLQQKDCHVETFFTSLETHAFLQQKKGGEEQYSAANARQALLLLRLVLSCSLLLISSNPPLYAYR